MLIGKLWKISKSIFFVILIFVFFVYLPISIGWKILNAQLCSMSPKSKYENLKGRSYCEAVARDDSENCKYIFLRWKNVNYDQEFSQCMKWISSKNQSTSN